MTFQHIFHYAHEVRSATITQYVSIIFVSYWYKFLL